MKHKSSRENTLVSPYRTMRERTRVLAELEDWLERPMRWLSWFWLVLVVVEHR